MRRRRSPWRGLLVLVIVLAVLLVGADRLALVVADRQIASKVQSSQQLSRRPSVSIRGFPFLTQVLANRYPDVHLEVTDLAVGNGDRTVRLADVNANLSQVRTIDNFSGAAAQTASGTARLTYQELSRVLGVKLGYAGAGSDGNGRVQASSSINVLGQTIAGTASAEVSVSGADLLTFSAVQVGVPQSGVEVPQSLTDQLASIFKSRLSLRGLPFHLQIQRLIATKDGLSISAVASGITLR